MKNILGLDLGTNSIGWALIKQDSVNNNGEIIKVGSRIIPMGEDVLGKFDNGITESGAAARTNFRGIYQTNTSSCLSMNEDKILYANHNKCPLLLYGKFFVYQ